MRRALAACAVLAGAGSALAQAVALQGTFGQRALLIVDGAAPKAVAVGETHQGVRLVSVANDQAVVEVGGVRQSLRVGEAPASVGQGAGGPRGHRIVLTAGTHGHFTGVAAVNGRAIPFLLDTGASTVALGAPDAERAGLNYRAGRPVRVNTANGATQGWFLKLSSLRIGEVEAYEVDAIVVPHPMPHMLLGNSFLTRFSMKRENEQMVLERRY
ncbi:TIGR02281 family clan AA aspartic protease [Ramlibacter rhizophilus]|uniref:TIGR02281 family clan AA aspartic protease n=1 Tax=Ramlibacter rhizophilus TaxID=1781167 RepID=A0A4Z0BMI6_9BURK|nr:TIGR02281 family clan AA aspartic protease [Ramlibacter rhizophilus]